MHATLDDSQMMTEHREPASPDHIQQRYLRESVNEIPT
jgi:hypothetical protein